VKYDPFAPFTSRNAQGGSFQGLCMQYVHTPYRILLRRIPCCAQLTVNMAQGRNGIRQRQWRPILSKSPGVQGVCIKGHCSLNPGASSIRSSHGYMGERRLSNPTSRSFSRSHALLISTIHLSYIVDTQLYHTPHDTYYTR
jgi:hypothetical protein